MNWAIDHILEAIGWSIVHSLWLGAILYVLLLSMFRAFPSLDAKMRHHLAYLAMSFLFFLFAGIFLYIAVFSTGAVQENVPTATVVWRLPKSKIAHLMDYLSMAYLVGLSVQLLLLLFSYYRVMRLRKTGIVEPSDELHGLFHRVRTYMGVGHQVCFYLSEKVSTPLVIGFIKPIVLFPVSLISHLDMVQVEAILIHELAHVRRNDYLLNIFRLCMRTFLFFNPFSLLIDKLVRDEREHACDEIVLQRTGAPIFYAETLFKLALLQQHQRRNAFSLATMGRGRSQLAHRIQRITAIRKQRTCMQHQLITIALIFFATLALAWIKPKPPGEVPPVEQFTIRIVDGYRKEWTFRSSNMQGLWDSLDNVKGGGFTIIDNENDMELVDALLKMRKIDSNTSDSLRRLYEYAKRQGREDSVFTSKDGKTKITFMSSGCSYIENLSGNTPTPPFNSKK
ncbi:M56 family metallopeptidase [Olivibacter sitiensis]|uniref:M56 family metallopeptidase n=1 Tax=Olivibacter sitiensis TaxID=376470 RepID=UPI00040523F5|nr:M56 family metallopeptidase [Olivibacter sitiensis]